MFLRNENPLLDDPLTPKTREIIKQVNQQFESVYEKDSKPSPVSLTQQFLDKFFSPTPHYTDHLFDLTKSSQSKRSSPGAK